METQILSGVQYSFATLSNRSRNGLVCRSNAAATTEEIRLSLEVEGKRRHLRSSTGLPAAAAAASIWQESGRRIRTNRSTRKIGWNSSGDCVEEALTLRRGRRRVSTGSKLDDEREETGISRSSKEKEEQKNSNGLVEKIEAELGRQFGGVLWYSVLFISLAIFGGGYAYFIINYADFSDIPILRGSQR